jgi:membrane associated rhomboid family serine protease
VGIYDRDYYRQERSGPSFPYVPQTVVGWIIGINVALWLVDSLFSPESRVGIGNGQSVVVGHWLSDMMAVHVDTLAQPWLWWQYLTAGFAHSPLRSEHILFNMLALFFLGRDVERVYGPKEFLRLYLVMVVFASVAWNVANLAVHTPGWVGAYGASGALAGVVVLFALNFPRATILLFFVLPMPAWLFGVLAVGMDIYGAMHADGSNVAYSMHLAGASFALLYYWRGWSLTGLTGRFAWPSFRRKAHLRVHIPEVETPPEKEAPSNLGAEVDRILEKIYREGESSLTAKERTFLEAASREYQRKNRD